MKYKLLLMSSILFHSNLFGTNLKDQITQFTKSLNSKKILLGISSGLAATYIYKYDIYKKLFDSTVKIIDQHPGSALFVTGLGIQLYSLKLSLNAQNTAQTSPKNFQVYYPGEIPNTLEDIAGAAEAKEDLKDILDFLKNPEKFQRLGAKIPKGVLLTGEPGNGKTLLAKSMAGEANCSFYSVTGSEFIEIYIGSGSSKIKNLFEQARKNAPSIIFIDEIDALGMKRSSNSLSSHENERTLNQLLSEMDGFNESPVIVIGATNRPDILDEALLRPGRFDRKVHVPYPSKASRLKILQINSGNKPLSKKINLEQMAEETSGFSGAELANIMNEAAIIAAQKNKKYISNSELSLAKDKILLGKPRSDIKQTEYDKTVTAYHEAGHALIRLLNPITANTLLKVTILPMGQSLGSTHSTTEEDKYCYSKEELEAEILCALGGRAAEELVFNKISTGASNDFQKATSLTYKMICEYGMSKLGPIYYKQDNISSKTADMIDEELRNLINQYYAQTLDLLKKNKDKLDIIAKHLIDKETLSGKDISKLLN